jgi:hypothetical protein
MNIENAIIPVIADDYHATVAHYRELLGLPVKREFQHGGFTVSWLGPMVVLGAEHEAALAIPRQVRGIFIVDDLAEAWRRLEGRTRPLVEPEAVPTGQRFIVRHPDGHAIEYIQLG